MPDAIDIFAYAGAAATPPPFSMSAMPLSCSLIF